MVKKKHHTKTCRALVIFRVWTNLTSTSSINQINLGPSAKNGAQAKNGFGSRGVSWTVQKCHAVFDVTSNQINLGPSAKNGAQAKNGFGSRGVSWTVQKCHAVFDVTRQFVPQSRCAGRKGPDKGNTQSLWLNKCCTIDPNEMILTSCLRIVIWSTSKFKQSFSLAKALQRSSGTLSWNMMDFDTTSWSQHGLKMVLCRFSSMGQLRNKCGINVCFTYNTYKNHSSRPLTSGDLCITMSGLVVNSLLSFAWLKQWLRRRDWHCICSNASIMKSLFYYELPTPSGIAFHTEQCSL